MSQGQQIIYNQELNTASQNKSQYSDMARHGFSPGERTKALDYLNNQACNSQLEHIPDDFADQWLQDDDQGDISRLDEVIPDFLSLHPNNCMRAANVAIISPFPKKFSFFKGQSLWNKEKKAYFPESTKKFMNDYLKIIKKYAKGKVELKEQIIRIHNKIREELHLPKITRDEMICSINYFIDFQQYKNQILAYIETNHSKLF